MRLFHTTAAPTGCGSIDYFELVEAVALQAAEVYAACEVYEGNTLPTMVRLHSATMSDFVATLSETAITWSSSEDRRRILSELRAAHSDLVGAFELVSDRAAALVPGYLHRVAGALSRVVGVLGAIESVLSDRDPDFVRDFTGVEVAVAA